MADRKQLLSLSKPALVKKCKKHKLSTNGTKNEIIDRIIKYQQNNKSAKKKKPKKNASNNNVYVIGENSDYQLGLYNNKNVKKLKNWTAKYKTAVIYVNCAYKTTIFTTKQKQHIVAGNNEHGQCGINNAKTLECKEFRKIKFFSKNKIKIDKVCTNSVSDTIFWISDQGKIYGNGLNHCHQLGLGDNKLRFEPELIKSLDNVIDAKSAKEYSLALCGRDRIIIAIITNWFKSQISIDVTNLIILFSCFNTVYATEYRRKNEPVGGNGLGSNYHDDQKWKEIKALSDKHIVKIACGVAHSLFLGSNGMVFCCGDNERAELGLGHSAADKNNLVPTEITYFTKNNIKINDIACGRYHSLAIDYNGRIYSWGKNVNGQCGHGSRGTSFRPKLIKSLEEYNIICVKCGGNLSYAMSDNRKHFIFGKNVGITSKGNNDDNKLPLCINDIVKEKTKGKAIKSVFLGYQNIIIIATNS